MLQVRPGLWTFWAWFIFVGVLLLLGLAIAFDREDPFFPLQLMTLALTATVSGSALILQRRPWTLEADRNGVRRVIRGKVCDDIPWERVREVRYGLRARAVSGRGGGRNWETATFLNIRDRARVHSIYVDTVYYKVGAASLARVTEYVLSCAESRGIRIAEGWS